MSWYVGTAGWSIPRVSSERCGGPGTHLQRYSRAFPCAEINSSFHRPHAAATYAKWAASTPPAFLFAVKVPKSITHDQRLLRARPLLQRFLDESAGLGAKRGPLLVQLPPSLAFEPRVANRFFALFRSLYDGPLTCEPRHQSWFGPADALLVRYQVARVAADPAVAAGAHAPGGWSGFAYFRLHGSPRTYWSSYARASIEGTAAAMRAHGDAWCIFDNTASGAALENAWELQHLLQDASAGATGSASGVLPRPAASHARNRGERLTSSRL